MADFNQRCTWRNELAEMLARLQRGIKPDDRAHEDCEGPSIAITVSTNDAMAHWAIQTGDNSFTGSCYGDPYWAVGEITPEDDIERLTDDLLDQLAGLWLQNNA